MFFSDLDVGDEFVSDGRFFVKMEHLSLNCNGWGFVTNCIEVISPKDEYIPPTKLADFFRQNSVVRRIEKEPAKYDRLYVIASLHRFGHNKHGWLMLDGSISEYEDGAWSFATIEEAETKIGEVSPRIRHPHIVRYC